MSGVRRDVEATLRGVGTVTWVAFGISASFLGLIVLVVAGYALTDPGGWRGFGLTVVWLVPLAGLAVLGLLRPSAAVPTLAVLTLLPLGFGAWSLVDFEGAHDWEDGVGPISLVLLVVVAAGLVTLGLSRPTVAGALLLVATVGPVLLAMVGAGSDWRVAVATVPFAITGALFLVAGAQSPGAARGKEHRRASAVL